MGPSDPEMEGGQKVVVVGKVEIEIEMGPPPPRHSRGRRKAPVDERTKMKIHIACNFRMA